MAAYWPSGQKLRLRLPPVAPIVRFGAAVFAFLLGIVGFHFAYADTGQHSTLGQIAVQSLRMTVGNFPADLEGRELPLALVVARIALPLLTFWTTIALAWLQVRNPLRLKLMRVGGEHLVIAGDAGLGKLSAEGELAAGHRVLLWADDKRLPWIDDLLDLGGAVVEMHGEGKGVGELGLDRARRNLCEPHRLSQ